MPLPPPPVTCSTFPPPPKCPGFWRVAHSWSPGSNALAPNFPSVSGSLLGNSLSRNPPPKVLSVGLHVHKALMESSRSCGDLLHSETPRYVTQYLPDFRTVRAVPSPCVTQRKQFLDLGTVFLRVQLPTGNSQSQLLPLSSGLNRMLAARPSANHFS